MLRIVHTADWHLGARLIEEDRLPEQGAFLDWFLDQLLELRPDLLIIAGDIFDTATPPQEALQLYYRFLARLSAKHSCQVLVLGGNHDSPATLHAPRELLEALRIRVIASPTENPVDSLLEFPEAVVCAVPFLRERDLRKASAGQNADEIADEIRTALCTHYQLLRTVAAEKAKGRLLLATGHLTAVGVVHSLSERDIHIGNLGAVSAACFEGFAYTALGHIHRPQSVDPDGLVRYAGSPIPLSFSEAGLDKEFRVIEIESGELAQRPVPIPLFRPVLRLSFSLDQLEEGLQKAEPSAATSLEPWIELTVTDGYLYPDLSQRVTEATKTRRVQVLKLLAPLPPAAQSQTTSEVLPALEELKPVEVFTRLLDERGLSSDPEKARALTLSFSQLLETLHERES